MSIETLEDPQAINPPGHSLEVTFHLAPQEEGKPFRRVAGITAPDGAWRDGYVDPATKFDTLTTTLPAPLSERVMAFARRHVGPEATDRQTNYYCHTFAQAVGHTAAESTRLEPDGTHYAGTAQAHTIFHNGKTVKSGDLQIGEHVTVGSPSKNESLSNGDADHSMVSIGNDKAIQIDSMNAGKHSGHLYIGKPDDYLKWLNAKNAKAGQDISPAELRVHREQEKVKIAEIGRIRRLGNAAWNLLRRKKEQDNQVNIEPQDPNNPWS